MRRALALIALTACLAGCGQGAPKVTLHPADAPPPRLSEWGLFHADGRQFSLGDNVFPYDLNTPLFTDYALKLRTVWLPEGLRVIVGIFPGSREVLVGILTDQTS